jgi:regulator of nucleoside diphosphate kinase
MSPNPMPPIVVTDVDAERLRTTLEAHSTARDEPLVERLLDELDRATVVPACAVPADVVTMNSRVAYRDHDSGDLRTVTLVYPHEADSAQGRLSVVAPVGAALLGMRVGQRITWPLPGGRTRTLEVVAVTWQPEAAGDFNQ